MLSLTVFDVGHASSALVAFGKRTYGIFDCGVGRRVGKNPLYVALRRAIVADPEARVAFLAVSHLDLDHISGLDDILGDPLVAGRIDRILCNHVEYRSLWEIARRALVDKPSVAKSRASMRSLKSLRRLLEFIQTKRRFDGDIHLEATSPSGATPEVFPTRLSIPGVGGEYAITLLAPSQRLRDALGRPLQRLAEMAVSGIPLVGELKWPSNDWNSASLVLTIEYAGRRVLLAGDSTADTWAEILRRSLGKKLNCDVVVCWHHGGKLGERAGRSYDTVVWSRLFPDTDGPGHVIVSTGRGNPYGHPSKETIQAIRERRGGIMCTELAACLRDHATVPAHAFGDAGISLTWGTPTDLSFLPPATDECCGDVRVVIDGTGSMEVTRGPSAERAHRRSDCCCSYQSPTETDDPTGGA
jgi:beta-lactamase superfamily II metal-dependent hydrolase